MKANSINNTMTNPIPKPSVNNNSSNNQEILRSVNSVPNTQQEPNTTYNNDERPSTSRRVSINVRVDNVPRTNRNHAIAQRYRDIFYGLHSYRPGRAHQYIHMLSRVFASYMRRGTTIRNINNETAPTLEQNDIFAGGDGEHNNNRRRGNRDFAFFVNGGDTSDEDEH